MRVVLIVGDYPPDISGIGDYTAVLAESLQRAGATVTVITSATDKAEAPAPEGAPRVIRYPRRWGLGELGGLIRLIRDLPGAEVVHIQYASVKYGRRLMINVLPLALRLLTDKTVIVTMHEFRERRLIWRLRAAPMLYGAHGIIHADPPDLAALRVWRRGSKARFACVEVCSAIEPVPVTNERRAIWRKQLGCPGPDPVVCFFGTAHPFKGFPTLFEALKLVRAQGTNVRLIGIGLFDFRANADYQRQMAELVRPAEQEGWAHVLAKGPAEDVSHAMHASDIAVFPFERGVTSNRSSVLSALAHGLPVVSTDGCDTPPGFAEKVPVLLTPPGQAEALAERIAALVASPDSREALRQKALAFSETRNWRHAANETLEFYAKVRGAFALPVSGEGAVGDERPVAARRRA